jgi:hypothetical protein
MVRIRFPPAASQERTGRPARSVQLGEELNGYKAEGKVSTFAEATAWLRDQACQHYPDSGFARKYCGFV